MTIPELLSYPSVKELAPQLRTYIIHEQDKAIARHGVFNVAVSGGSLPKTLAQALLNDMDGKPVHWDKWQIYFADERCVPLDHDDSNYKLVKTELLDKITGDEKPVVHSMSTKTLEDADESADAYHSLLISKFAAKDSVKYPCFDLLLLGCGPDGHTCSLFPGHPLLRETHGWVLGISDSPKPPPKRITLSLPVVLHAAKIAFVATGAGKKELFQKLFETEEGKKLPCGLVNSGAHGEVTWFTDRAATEGLSKVTIKSGL